MSGCELCVKGIKEPLREYAKRMRAPCECGRMFGEHGARCPHDRGEECSGFRKPATTPRGGR